MAEDEPRAHDKDTLTEASTLSAPDDVAGPLPDQVDGEVGAYRILTRLGAGGFAEVFLADQVSPVRRRVAIKIIRPGLESREVLARFQAERHALALLDHPNIAKVFDAGVTEAGLPFFVMEFVPGVPISKHCERSHLGVVERLEIFLQTCSAVQHAHQKGVIHRDLKPSNVLVAVQDGRPFVKVIDFGVAKAIQRDLIEETPVTRIGQVIGTLEYMSPEQAELTAQGIDTRSDVYSLGVLLYELLTGTLPFDPDRLRKAAQREVQRIICEEDPPKPSTRVSGLVDSSDDWAKRQRTDPRSLIRQLRGDLDWIIMKAMEKDRSHRYASASELAADIERFRRNEPVMAGPPSAGYRFRKFVRRHRVGVGAAAAVALALIAGIISTSVFAVGQARARAEAQAESQRAQTVIAFLRKMLSSADPAHSPSDVLVLDVVERSARQLELGPPRDPEVESAIRTAIGATYLGLSRLEEADRQLRRALEIQAGIHGEEHASVGEILHYLGWLALWRSQLDEAEALSRRSLEISREQLPDDDPRLADIQQDLGFVLQQAGRLDEAEAMYRKALNVSERSPGATELETALIKSQLGSVVAVRGRLDEAEALEREALATFRAAGEPLHVRAPEVISALAWVLEQSGQLDEAISLAREALGHLRAEYGDDSPFVAQTLVQIGQIERARDDMVEAKSAMLEAVEIYTRTLGESDVSTALATLHLATVLDDSGESERAAALFPQAIEALRARYGGDHWQVANARNRYGLCLLRLGRFEQAERELLAAHEVLEAAGLRERALLAAGRLANLYEAMGDDAEALRWRSLLDSP